MAPWKDDFTVSQLIFLFVFILEISEIHSYISCIQEVIFHLTIVTTLCTATFNLMSSECAR